MGLEELHVRPEIRAEIAPGPERQDECLHPPEGQCGEKHDRGAPPRPGEHHCAPGKPRKDRTEGAHDGTG